MRKRDFLLVALAAVALVGCGPTRTVTGEVSPSVAAIIRLAPAPGAPLSKPETELATNVITERLKTLGVGTFSIAAGNDIKVSIGAGVDLLDSQLAVQVPGLLRFGIGSPGGSPLASDAPDGLAPLWQDDEVVAVSEGTDSGGHSTVSIQLSEAGAAALAAFTAGHVGEQLTVALDGWVLAVMAIAAPAAGGTTLTFAAPDFMPVKALTAILLNGPLPAGWRQP